MICSDASSDVSTRFANTWFNQFECQELKFSSKHNICEETFNSTLYYNDQCVFICLRKL